MIRKYLFLGFTLVLIAVVAALIIGGHRLEKQRNNQATEVTRKSESTATRVWNPRDLEIVHSEMQLVEDSKEKHTLSALHEIEIHNNGKISYRGIKLNFDYLDRQKQMTANRSYTTEKTILPGTTLKLDDLIIGNIPALTTGCRVIIVYADIKSSATSGDLQR